MDDHGKSGEPFSITVAIRPLPCHVRNASRRHSSLRALWTKWAVLRPLIQSMGIMLPE